MHVVCRCPSAVMGRGKTAGLRLIQHLLLRVRRVLVLRYNLLASARMISPVSYCALHSGF